MQSYRLYFLDRKRRIQSVKELTFASDSEAITFSGQQAHTHGMELWQQARKVHAFMPEHIGG